MNDFFNKLASTTSNAVGSPIAFSTALLIVIVWAGIGPVFHFSDTWQLTINTASSIIPSLMVFLIQNTQNRDARATQLKLDELLRAVEGAHTSFIDLEHLSDDEIAKLEKQFQSFRSKKPADVKNQ